MTILKYKAKIKGSNNEAIGYLIKSYDERYFIGYSHNSTSLDADEIIENTIKLSTGMTDIFRKEIFEGDKIKFSLSPCNKATMKDTVLFANGAFKLDKNCYILGALYNIEVKND